LSITPASGTYSVGSVATLTINEDSNSNNANAVEADLTFPSSLEYESYSVASSGFDFAGPAPTISSSSFKYDMLSSAPLTGSQQVFTISFKVLSAGSATVDFASTAAVINDGQSQNAVKSGATLTLQAETTTTTTTAIPPTVSVPTKTPVAVTAVAPKTTVSTDTSITPAGSTTPVSVTSGSTAQISQPATIKPTAVNSAVADNPVVKVLYYLNGKLVDTVTAAPFTYNFQTDNQLNGNYTLMTKTYYADGTTKTTTTNLDVNNKESLKQIKLAAKHYAGPSSILLVLIVIVVALIIARKRVSYCMRNRISQRLAPQTAAPDVTYTPNSSTTPDNTRTTTKPIDIVSKTTTPVSTADKPEESTTELISPTTAKDSISDTTDSSNNDDSRKDV
jgi:hypothetical protein